MDNMCSVMRTVLTIGTVNKERKNKMANIIKGTQPNEVKNDNEEQLVSWLQKM